MYAWQLDSMLASCDEQLAWRHALQAVLPAPMADGFWQLGGPPPPPPPPLLLLLLHATTTAAAAPTIATNQKLFFMPPPWPASIIAWRAVRGQSPGGPPPPTWPPALVYAIREGR